MSKFSKQDIVDYYNQTEIHYRDAWDLEESMAMHYGYWREDTKSFRDSLQHMVEEMAKMAGIGENDLVLDAGCGVGGSSIFLSKNIGCRAIGITLAPKQAESAKKNAAAQGVSERTEFYAKDYLNTGFPENHFDVVWGLESVIHAPDKQDFVNEAFRILKPGGRLIIGDYYLKEGDISRKQKKSIDLWLDYIAAEKMPRVSEFKAMIEQAGFSSSEFTDITPQIRKSSWRQFYGSLFMQFLSWGYRLLHPNVSHFADNHYKVMRHQYIALWRKAWKYYFVFCVK